jgi:hypothetical protein
LWERRWGKIWVLGTGSGFKREVVDVGGNLSLWFENWNGEKRRKEERGRWLSKSWRGTIRNSKSITIGSGHSIYIDMTDRKTQKTISQSGLNNLKRGITGRIRWDKVI